MAPSLWIVRMRTESIKEREREREREREITVLITVVFEASATKESLVGVESFHSSERRNVRPER